MTLDSRHYEILTRVRSTLIADTDLVAAIPDTRWTVSKQPYHVFYKWQDGVNIVPVASEFIDNENQMQERAYSVLVSAVNLNEQELTTNLEERLAFMERVEEIFCYKPKAKMPYLFSHSSGGLNAWKLDTDPMHMTFQFCRVEPGNRFLESLFQQNHDGNAVIISTHVNVKPQDHSTLGQP